MKTLYHECHFGLGDNIYELPFVLKMAQEFDRVYVLTPFPWLYTAQGVDPEKFVFLPRHSRLHLQEESIKAFKGWGIAPDPAFITKSTCFWKSGVDHSLRCVPDRFLCDSGQLSVDFAMKIPEVWKTDARSALKLKGILQEERLLKIAIIKRPTLRKEWLCPARNPKIEYFQQAIHIIQKDHFIISVADVREGEEWLDGDIGCEIDLELHHKELDIQTLIGLVSLADISLCPPSFFIPLCNAIDVPCFCIYGGSGDPSWHTSPWMMRSRYGFAAPDPFCACGQMVHDCNKEIQDFESKFGIFLERLGRR